MKKRNFFTFIILLSSVNLVFAQEPSASKLQIIAYGGIGYGTVKNDNQPDYNLNSNGGEILLNLALGEHYGLATGFGYNELSGDGFNDQGNFFHQRNLIKIPLLFTLRNDINESLSLFGNMGFFGQHIVKDEHQFLTETQTDLYEGWNLGAQFSLGFLFRVSDQVNAGIIYNGQSDLSKFEASNSAVSQNKQKLENLNSVGLMLKFDL